MSYYLQLDILLHTLATIMEVLFLHPFVVQDNELILTLKAMEKFCNLDNKAYM